MEWNFPSQTGCGVNQFGVHDEAGALCEWESADEPTIGTPCQGVEPHIHPNRGQVQALEKGVASWPS